MGETPVIGHWDDELAYKLVYPIVLAQDKLGRLKHFPDLTVQDVTSDLVADAWFEFDKFDPLRSKFSTWLTHFAIRRVHNKPRGRARLARHEGRYAQDMRDRRDYVDGVAVVSPTYEAGDVLDPPERRAGEGETFEGEIVGADTDGGYRLHEWLELIYRHAKKITAERSRQGHTYEHAQALAVAALAQKLKTSGRGTRGVFEDRPELCQAVGFPPIPSVRWFHRSINIEVGTESRKNSFASPASTPPVNNPTSQTVA